MVPSMTSKSGNSSNKLKKEFIIVNVPATEKKEEAREKVASKEDECVKFCSIMFALVVLAFVICILIWMFATTTRDMEMLKRAVYSLRRGMIYYHAEKEE